MATEFHRDLLKPGEIAVVKNINDEKYIYSS